MASDFFRSTEGTPSKKWEVIVMGKYNREIEKFLIRKHVIKWWQ